MKIEDYYKKLQAEINSIFEASIKAKTKIGGVHLHAVCMAQIADTLFDADERDLMRLVAGQVDSSGFIASFGLYRSAMASVRLAFEMGMAAILFSANKFAHREWMAGQEDIRWSILNDENSGVFSKRFARAFFPQCESVCESFRLEANSTYRALSEFVHGNSDTWRESGLKIEYSEAALEKYFSSVDSVCKCLKFAFCLRYLPGLDANERDDIGPYILPELSHLAPIQNFLSTSK